MWDLKSKDIRNRVGRNSAKEIRKPSLLRKLNCRSEASPPETKDWSTGPLRLENRVCCSLWYSMLYGMLYSLYSMLELPSSPWSARCISHCHWCHQQCTDRDLGWIVWPQSTPKLDRVCCWTGAWGGHFALKNGHIQDLRAHLQHNDSYGYWFA